VGNSIEFQVFNAQDGAWGTAAPAKDRANARGKLGKGEGLGDKIVCAGIEAPHAIFERGRSGHDQDRQLGFLRPDIAKHLQTCGTREIQVENHEVARLVGGKAFRFDSIGNYADCELLLLKALAEELRQSGIIFRDKNSHWLTL
jgi:hypothetical protein